MFHCMFCEKLFLLFQHLKCHIKLKHSEKLYTEVTCNFPKCMNSYSTVYSLFRHISTTHDTLPGHKTMIKKSESSNESINNAVSSICTDLNLNNTVSLENIYEEDKNYNFIQDFHNTILNLTLSLITRLYCVNNLNRKDVHKIINDIFCTYLSQSFEMLKKKHGNTSNISNDLNTLTNVLKKFKSEHYTLKYLTNINCFIQPLQKIIHSSLVPKRVKCRKQLVIYRKKITIIPVKLILQKFLELPNVFNSILENINKSKKNDKLVTSIFHGEMWNCMEPNENGLTLPIAIFFDDFEINNPLGSRKSIHKLGAIYLSLLCLPPQYSSIINNIFLMQLHNYQDHNNFGNKILLHVVDQIIDLSVNGITINVEKEYKIFFRLMFITGDNLGLNTICGFSQGFNSQYYCRICSVTKKVAQNLINEETHLIRTQNNYYNDVTNSTCGIKEECIFNKVPNFNICENVAVDPMHDILEGICRYDLGKILNNFIYIQYFFTLNVLNERLLNCPTSFSDNVTPQLKSESIKKEKIIITASEMHYLVNNLSLMVGDIVPEGNLYWQLYLLLKKIMNMSFSPFLTSDCINLFHTVVCKYLSLHKTLFHSKFKPKHHNLLHYSRIMKKYGPLNSMSCIRFEAKHKQLKSFAKVTSSRLNPSYTLALKHQLNLCYRFVCAEGFSYRFQHNTKVSKLTEVSDYLIIKNVLHVDMVHDDLYIVSWVEIHGTRYETNNVICTNIYERSFGKIRYIICNERKELLFVCEQLSVLSFNRHKSAYKILENKQLFYIKQKDLVDYKVYFLSHDNYIFCENLFNCEL